MLRETVPSDWEYRYQAMLVWNFEPGTTDRHRCRLTPRSWGMLATAVETRPEPLMLPAPRPAQLPGRTVPPAAGSGFIDG